MSSIRRPPFDPEVAATLAAMSEQGTLMPTLTAELIPIMRQAPQVGEDLSVFDVERRDITVPGYGGAELTMSVFARNDHQGDGPGIFAVHGGGMVMGDRLTGMSLILPWVVEHDAVAVTVDYRLAPEFPDPVPVEDCYAALAWTAEHARELGIDPSRIVMAGASAGGGLIAGTALLARDRSGPPLLGLMLSCPMLDDRDSSRSAQQFDGLGFWNRASNKTAWRALLGERAGGPSVSIYAAPSRATDLSGLPPVFIDVGSAEVFRDECVNWASQLWADGGVAELHVWPGGTHGWEAFAQNGMMSKQASDARSKWLARVLVG